MSAQISQLQSLTILHRKATAFGTNSGAADFKTIIDTAFRLNVVTSDDLRKEFGTEKPKIQSWRKGGAASKREAMEISLFIANRAEGLKEEVAFSQQSLSIA